MSERTVWIDSHCHLTDPRFSADIERILGECLDDGISHFIQGGINPEEWDRQRVIAQHHPNQLSLVFGLHPWWVDEKSRAAGRDATPESIFSPALQRLENEMSAITAIGEAGLDFARKRREESGDAQLWVFQKQLELARRYQKPLVLHIVQAHFETLSILKRRSQSDGVAFRGLVHSFSGTYEEAKQYAALGFLISVGCRGMDESARELQRILEGMPMESLVFETDSPDQPPKQFKDNPEFEHSPRSLHWVARHAAKLRGASAEEILNQATRNLTRVFSLKLFQ